MYHFRRGKPEIQEIIWDDVDVRNLNTRLADDGLKLAGDLDIFVMYIGNGETGNVQWYETTASFGRKPGYKWLQCRYDSIC